MTRVLDVSLGDVASIATAVSVAVAAGALWRTESQARTQFEDGLAQQYRAIAEDLPLDALLGKRLPETDVHQDLRAFYRYVDLTNEQVYLRMKGRVRASTWKEWSTGIAANFKRPAFNDAWKLIRTETGEQDFAELARLLREQFEQDPRKWS